MVKNERWNHPLFTAQENALAYDYCEECLSDKEVAEKRNISINTVQTHKKSMFIKAGINKITQLSKLFFTVTYIMFLFLISGLGRSSSRLNIRIQGNRTYISRTHRRSRRRIDNTYMLDTTFYIPPITA